MNVKRKKRTEGFTLIEAIVVLVVTAIVGTIFITFLGKSFLESFYKPRENLVRAKDLNQVMANIRADYKPYPVWKPGHTFNLGDKVMPTAFSLSGQRYWYECRQAGTSGSTDKEPAWTKEAAISENSPSTVVWQYKGDLMTLSALRDYIGAVDTGNKKCASIPSERCYDKSTKQYGYYVTERKWIDFDPNTKTELVNEKINKNIINVKFSQKHDSGETVAVVTALFF
jgi:type II secretory pathway pseudopilin PulG